MPRADMVLSKIKKGHRFSHVALLSIFLLEPNCPSFQASVNRDFTANEYLAQPFNFLWSTLFICVQNFTSFFMLETAQRGLSNCAAAHARSLEGTLLATVYSDFPSVALEPQSAQLSVIIPLPFSSFRKRRNISR